jgi:hypothetical protein
MQQRRETAEHPFGTIKAWMGATHFKMKTLTHVATEMALHVLAYNIKRVIAILAGGRSLARQGLLGAAEAVLRKLHMKNPPKVPRRHHDEDERHLSSFSHSLIHWRTWRLLGDRPKSRLLHVRIRGCCDHGRLYALCPLH